jgi:predicted nucleic acid-binding Zn ribbon protein
VPIYVYKCPCCGAVEEFITWAGDKVKPVCYRTEDCAYEMEKQPTAGAIHFKGSGWTPRGTK